MKSFRFPFLSIFIFILSDQSRLSHAAILNCEALSGQSPKSLVEDAVKGVAIHENGLETIALSSASADELEIPQLHRLWSDQLQTSMGKDRLMYRMTHPYTDAEVIRGVQAGVKEIRSDSRLADGITEGLAAIRNYETRNSKWERFWRGVWKKLHIPFPPAPNRNIATTIAEYNTSDHAVIKIFGYLRAYGFPLVGWTWLATKVPGLAEKVPDWGFVNFARNVGLIALYNNVPSQWKVRSSVKNFRSLFLAADTLAKVFAKAESPYLRELAEILAATTNPNHDLKVYESSRFGRHLITNMMLSRLLDSLFISNVSLFPKLQKFKRDLFRISTIASVLAEIDVLGAFAKLSARDGYVMPEILDETQPPEISIREGSHPIIHWRVGTQAVPNDVDMGTGPDKTQIMFITGPNARGKTTYMRKVALFSMIAQAGGPVPAQSMRLRPLRVLSSMKNSDSTVSDESTFRAEAKRLAQIIKEAKASKIPVVIFLDEMFTGTSQEEKTAAEIAFIHFLQRQGCIAFVASHNRQLTTLEQYLPGFRNFHVSDDDARMFRMEPGPSNRRNAFEVMAEEGFPADVLDDASRFFKSLMESVRGWQPPADESPAEEATPAEAG